MFGKVQIVVIPDHATLRRLAVKFTVDPRTIVRHMRGEKIRGDAARRNAAMATVEWESSKEYADAAKQERATERVNATCRPKRKPAPKRARKAKAAK